MLILFKNCLSRGIISLRKNILCKHKKYGWYSHENRVTRMRCQNGLKKQKFQNILSVADSGVIEKIPLKSLIIYESHWHVFIFDLQSSCTLQKMMCHFFFKSPNFKTILAGSKSMVLQ